LGLDHQIGSPSVYFSRHRAAARSRLFRYPGLLRLLLVSGKLLLREGKYIALQTGGDEE
jgi:hypothetical protein